jgi:hypothetical protein
MRNNRTVTMYDPDGLGGAIVRANGQVISVHPSNGAQVPITEVLSALTAGLSFKVFIGGETVYVPPAT